LFESSPVIPTSGDVQTAPPGAPPFCRGDLPLVLLPVRLETRFFTVGASTELRIRVYPDKIHIDCSRSASARSAPLGSFARSSLLTPIKD
jgi:hypothetical protein